MTTETECQSPVQKPKKKKRKIEDLGDESFAESFSAAKKQRLESPGILLCHKKKEKKHKKGISRRVSFNLSKNTSKIIDSSLEELQRSYREAEKLKQEQKSTEENDSTQNEVNEQSEQIIKKKKKKKRKEASEDESNQLEKHKKKKRDKDNDDAITTNETEGNPSADCLAQNNLEEKSSKKSKIKKVKKDQATEECDEVVVKKLKKKKKKDKDRDDLDSEIHGESPEKTSESKKRNKKKHKERNEDEVDSSVQNPTVNKEEESQEVSGVENVNDVVKPKKKKKKHKKDHECDENAIDNDLVRSKEIKKEPIDHEIQETATEEQSTKPKKKKKEKKDHEVQEIATEDQSKKPKKKRKHKKDPENQTPDVAENEEVADQDHVKRKEKKKKKKERKERSSEDNEKESGDEQFNPTVIKPKKEKKKKKKETTHDSDASIPIPVYTSTPAPHVTNPAFRDINVQPMDSIDQVETDSEDEEFRDENLSQISSIMQETCTIPRNIMNLNDSDEDMDIASGNPDSNNNNHNSDRDSDAAPLGSYEERAKMRDMYGRMNYAKRMAQLPEMEFNFDDLEHCCDYRERMEWQDSPNAEILHSLPYRRIGKEEREELAERGITVKRNRWLREEEHRLRMNYKAFVEAHKKVIDFEPHLLANLPNETEEEEWKHVMKFRKQHNFIRSLALGLERDLEFISLKASKFLNKHWNKGRFSAEEENQLKELVKEHGAEQASKIANIMGRTVQCIIDKIVYETEDRKKGRWSLEEDEKLKKAIAEVSEHTGAEATETGKFPWGTVVAMVPGRNKSQCRNRWLQVLGNDKKSQNLSLRVKLIDYLEKLVEDMEEPLDDRAIDWKKAADEVGFPSKPVCVVTWKKMKSSVAEGEMDLCVQGCLKRLQAKKVRWTVKSQIPPRTKKEPQQSSQDEDSDTNPQEEEQEQQQ